MSERDARSGGPGALWDLSFLDPLAGGAGGARGDGVPASNAVGPRVTGLTSGGQGGGVPSHGLNVPVCEDLSYGLAHDADSLEEVIEDADFSVRRIREEWHGPDAERWQATWSTQRRHLSEATEGLVAMRRGLEIAIEEQQRASRA
jgi:uncharacterized protein YukE